MLVVGYVTMDSVEVLIRVSVRPSVSTLAAMVRCILASAGECN